MFACSVRPDELLLEAVHLTRPQVCVSPKTSVSPPESTLQIKNPKVYIQIRDITVLVYAF